MKESPIFARTYDLLRWLIPATLKFPRQHRFVMATVIQQSVLSFHQRLLEAARSGEPKAVLLRADVTLAQLRVYLRLCRDMEILGMNQYEHAARLMDEVGRLLGAWLKSHASQESGPARSR